MYFAPRKQICHQERTQHLGNLRRNLLLFRLITLTDNPIADKCAFVLTLLAESLEIQNIDPFMGIMFCRSTAFRTYLSITLFTMKRIIF